MMQAPPTDFNRSVDLGQGLFVCGDHRDSATLNGALLSGRRAASAAASYLQSQQQGGRQQLQSSAASG